MRLTGTSGLSAGALLRGPQRWVSSLAAVVYFAGPFIAFGSWHPLENAIVRNIVILLLVAGAAAIAGFSFP